MRRSERRSASVILASRTPPFTSRVEGERVTSDLSDWATNCPEYKVTAVEVVRVGPTRTAGVSTAEPVLVPVEAKA